MSQNREESASKQKSSLKNEVYKTVTVLSESEFDEWYILFSKKKAWASDGKDGKYMLYFCNRKRRRNKFCEYSGSVNCQAKVRMIYCEPGRWTLRADDAGLEHLKLQGLTEFSTRNPSEIQASSSNILYSQVGGVENWIDQFRGQMQDIYAPPQRLPEAPQFNGSTQPTIINVSEHNLNIDWMALKEVAKIEMVIARSSRGATIDKRFNVNFRAMKNANFTQLAVYHMFFGEDDAPTPEVQFHTVSKALEEVGFDKQKDVFVIGLQTENNPKANPLNLTSKFVQFISLLFNAGFMQPVFYCNNNSWNTLIDTTHFDDEWFSNFPLWIANYTDNQVPIYPNTWKSRGIQWWLWQYNGSASVDRFAMNVGFNRLNNSYSGNNIHFHPAI